MAGSTRSGKILVWLLSFAGVLAGGRANAELIGFWDLVAPVSARLVNPGNARFFDWLNVVDAPVSIEEAFTGYGMLDDGYANLSRDTVVELDYKDGVARNRPGADLVLLSRDFQYDAFAVTTSFDGFQQEFLLGGSAFAATGPMRFYYYGGAPGLYGFFIYAVPIDLSQLGVDDDAWVRSIRVRGTVDDGGDLFGVGAIRAVAEPSTLALLLLGTAFVAARRSA